MQSLEEMKGKNLPDDVIESLIKTGKGDVIQNVENIVRIFQMSPTFKDQLRFDTWTDKLYILDDGVWRDFRDTDYIKLQRMLSLTLAELSRVPKMMVIDAVNCYMYENAEDTAIDYMRSLKWDKKDRLNSMIHIVYGCEDNAYHTAVGENFVKGMVARVVNAGVKFDTVLCIEGEQGIGKSTSLSILAGELSHLETTIDPENKDFLMQMKGNLIIEFTEGVIMNKKDAANMKGFVSKQIDVFRNPYGMITNNVPRRCVFAMTTNNNEYLKDSTGNRRFLPIYADYVDTKWLRENRDQLFAEALHRYEVLEEPIHVYPDSAVEYQNSKIITSPHSDLVSTWTMNPHSISESGMEKPIDGVDINGGFTIIQIWVNVLHNRIGSLKSWEEMQLSDTLKNLGFHKKRNVRNGVRATRWYRNDEIDIEEEFK